MYLSILAYGSVLWARYSFGGSYDDRKSLSDLISPILLVHTHTITPQSSSVTYAYPALLTSGHFCNLISLSNLMSDKIDSTSLLSRLSFKIPLRHTRSFPPFIILSTLSSIHKLSYVANTDPSCNSMCSLTCIFF